MVSLEHVDVGTMRVGYRRTGSGVPVLLAHGAVSDGRVWSRVVDRLGESYDVVAWDAPGQTFRHAEYAEYKGTRKETDPAMIAQIEPARRLIQDLGIPLLECVGYEADDVIATLACPCAADGGQCAMP